MLGHELSSLSDYSQHIPVVAIHDSTMLQIPHPNSLNLKQSLECPQLMTFVNVPTSNGR